MSCSPTVPCDIDAIAERSAPCNTDLCGETAVLSDHNVVRDLDKIIQLRATFDERFRKRRPINRRIGTNFDIIFNNDSADLRNFVVSVADRREPEPVAPNNSAAVDNHSVPNRDFLSDTNVWIDKSIITDFRAFTDIDERLNDGVVADLNIVSDVSKRLN